MKVIISDLDGTLLCKDETDLNKNTKNMINSVLNSGNAFCVASGRNYTELKHLFREFEDHIYFICNDGALGIYKENTFYNCPLDKNLFYNFTKYTAHGKYVTYVRSDSSLFIRNTAKKYKGHVMQIESISDITEDIYKISDFDKSLSCPLPIVYKDNNMKEYVSAACDKANAVEYLINFLKLKKSDVYVFGDNINDVNMLQRCCNSYAVANAIPKVKKCAKKVANNIYEEIINIIKSQ